MGFISKFFGWWTAITPGTWLSMRKARARQVGADEFGNRYFEATRIREGEEAKRRWVIYDDYAEASAIPAIWHAWLHHSCELPPSEQKIRHHAWEKPHLPNMTGTFMAYFPDGSLVTLEERAKSSVDYQAWQPGESE